MDTTSVIAGCVIMNPTTPVCGIVGIVNRATFVRSISKELTIFNDNLHGISRGQKSNASTVRLGLVIANFTVPEMCTASYGNATACDSCAILYGEAVDKGGMAGILYVDHALCMVAIQNAGMSLKIPERQVVIIGLVALESAINMTVSKHIKAVVSYACS